jgi:hypothetical protein
VISHLPIDISFFFNNGIKIINYVTMVACALLLLGAIASCWASCIKTTPDFIPPLKFLPNILLIVPIILCNLTNEVVEFTLNPADIKTASIVISFFGNPISGLLILGMRSAAKKQTAAVAPAVEEAPVVEEATEAPVEE